MCDRIQPTFASFIQEVCNPRLCATYLCNATNLCNIQLIKRPGLQVKVARGLQDHLAPALECGSQALTVTYQNYADHAYQNCLLAKLFGTSCLLCPIVVTCQNYLELVAYSIPS